MRERRAKDYFQKTPCQLCGDELWVRVAHGRELKDLALWRFSFVEGLMKYDGSVEVASSFGNATVAFGRHTLLRGQD